MSANITRNSHVARRTRSRSRTPHNLERKQEEFMRGGHRDVQATKRRRVEHTDQKQTSVGSDSLGSPPSSPGSESSQSSNEEPISQQQAPIPPQLQPVLGLDESELNQIHFHHRFHFPDFSKIMILYPHGASELCLELQPLSTLTNIQPTESPSLFQAMLNINLNVTRWFQNTIDRRFQWLVEHNGNENGFFNPTFSYQPIDLDCIVFTPSTQFQVACWLKDKIYENSIHPVSFEAIKQFCHQQKRINSQRNFSVKLTLMLRHLLVRDRRVLPKVDIIGMMFVLTDAEHQFVVAQDVRLKQAKIRDESNGYEVSNEPTDEDERSDKDEQSEEQPSRPPSPNPPPTIQRRTEKRKQFSRSELIGLLVDQDFCCANKRCRIKLTRDMEKDHKIPLHLGGTDSLYNLQYLCPECHRKKSRQERDMLNNMY